jgi:hypothetical protein
MLARLEQAADFDEDTPFFEGISGIARSSVAAALDAAALARQGKTVFSLMRPPGHHALREKSMGFCYLNNVAIAVLEAQAAGVRRIGVFDFDVHHGNGTENILLNQAGIEFFSVHEHPGYPDTGGENHGWNCFNYPVVPNAPRLSYRVRLANAMEDLRSYHPELVAVSARRTRGRDIAGGGFSLAGRIAPGAERALVQCAGGRLQPGLARFDLRLLERIGGKAPDAAGRSSRRYRTPHCTLIQEVVSFSFADSRNSISRFMLCR